MRVGLHALGLTVTDYRPAVARASSWLHVPMDRLLQRRVSLYGRVHSNEPLRDTPHINACIEQTNRPFRSRACSRSGSISWPINVPEGATTVDRI